MIVLRTLGITFRVLANAAFLGIPVGLVIALLPYFEGAESYGWINRVMVFDAAVMEAVRSVVPTQLGALDLGRAFVLVLLLFFGLAMDYASNRFLEMASSAEERHKERQKRKRKAKKAAAREAAAKKVDRRRERRTGQRDNQQRRRASDEPRSREELVRLMVEAKRKLDAMTRDVAFLALDVVESTNMKIGEDPAFVEHDFKQFKRMVDAAVERHGPLKAAWTPDGAMICFDSLDGAIRAAQAMLQELPQFNTGTRMMQMPFRVRCGVNAGRVQFDAATPMEEMSDNVIDVAGHMQKYADPDTIFAASELLRKKKVTRGFSPAETEVDGYPVSMWRGPSADPVSRPAAAPTESDATMIVDDPTLELAGTGSDAKTMLGKYEVRGELGRGAMGGVPPVQVKLLPPVCRTTTVLLYAARDRGVRAPCKT